MKTQEVLRCIGCSTKGNMARYETEWSTKPLPFCSRCEKIKDCATCNGTGIMHSFKDAKRKEILALPCEKKCQEVRDGKIELPPKKNVSIFLNEWQLRMLRNPIKNDDHIEESWNKNPAFYRKSLLVEGFESELVFSVLEYSPTVFMWYLQVSLLKNDKLILPCNWRKAENEAVSLVAVEYMPNIELGFHSIVLSKLAINYFRKVNAEELKLK